MHKAVRTLILSFLALSCALGTSLRVSYAEEESSAATYAGKDAAWWIGQLGESRTQPAGVAALRILGQAAIPDMGRALGADSSLEIREAVWDILGHGRVDVAPIIDELSGLLRSGEEREQLRVLSVLARSKGSERAMNDVVAALQVPALTQSALSILSTAGSRARLKPETVALLITSENTRARLIALGQLGRSRELRDEERIIIESLAWDTDASVARTAMRQLSHWKAGTIGHATLVRLAKSPDAKHRRLAARDLLLVTDADDASRRQVVAMLDDLDPLTQATAARALATSECVGIEAVPALTRMIRGPHGLSRVAACMAFGRAGSAATSAIPLIVRAAKGRNGYQEARQALRTLWPVAQKGIVESLEAMDVSERIHFFQLALQLGVPTIEPLRGQWVKALVHTLKDATANLQMRQAALNVLCQPELRGAECTRGLIDVGAHASEAVRGMIMARSKDLVHLSRVLLEAAKDEDEAVRDYAFCMIERSRVPLATPQMVVSLLGDSSAATRSRITRFLCGWPRPGRHGWRPMMGLVYSGLHRSQQSVINELDPHSRTRFSKEVSKLLSEVDARELVAMASGMPNFSAFGEDMVPHLLRAMDLADREVIVNRIVSAMRDAGMRFPQRVIPMLIARLDSPDPIKAVRAARVLAQIPDYGNVLGDRERLIELAARVLNSKNLEARRAGVDLANALAKHGRPLLERLVTLYQQPLNMRSEHLALVLAHVAPTSELVLELLRSRYADGETRDLHKVPYALAIMGEPGVTALLGLLDPADSNLGTLLNALGAVQDKRPKVVSALEALLEKDGWSDEQRRMIRDHLIAFREGPVIPVPK